ncbi:dCTP deaminase [Nocardioides sp. WS12]|uniref:dCTP deaminase n=1 Tax=Nocardioides sp. WS12 TaxID=2486272 RepID=UPI0015F7D632|nr:dCTP deaminase [Nocardioides sp. WS12]
MGTSDAGDKKQVRHPQAVEFKRALSDRLNSLEDELAELAGRYLGADGEPPSPSSIPNSGTGETDERTTVAQELLNELLQYPDAVRKVINRRFERATRSDVLLLNLRAIAANLIEATKNIERWFTSPHSADIPTALDTALQSGIRSLGIRDHYGLITAGDPDQLDKVVDDARQDIFFQEAIQPEIRIDEDEERPDPPPPVAVFRTPFHEAGAPRYWPIVLGHELAHLKLATDERNQTEQNESSSHQVGGVELSGEQQIYLLNRIKILDRLDLDRLEQIIEKERRVQQLLIPQPPGLGEPASEKADTPASPVAARVAIANDWVEEIVCDLVMVRRFGPAAIAAMANFLTAVGSWAPLTISHPPGYFRTEIMLDYLGEVPVEFDPIVSPWRKAGDAEHGWDPIPELEDWAGEMFRYIRDNRTKIYEFVDTWPDEQCDVTDDNRKQSIGLALQQIKFGLPPFHAAADAFTATTTQGGDEVAPPGPLLELDDVDVMNAGWLAVTQREHDDDSATNPNGVHRKIPVDRLLLKSIETIQLLTKYPQLATNPTSTPTSTPLATAMPGAILGHEEIQRRLDCRDYWRRIIVTPRIIEPGTAASIDLRLGNRFIVFQRTGISTFNARRGNNPRAVQRFIERPFNSPFVLHPGEVVLASALEYIALPIDVGAQVITRSSYGRLGLITATAVQVHPLYRGCLTLELVNLGTVPLTLYPGERVAQLVFFNVQVSDPERELNADDFIQGSYICPTAPEFPDVKIDDWMREPPREVL